MSFDLARKVADAVLYEGYVLYPYRASAVKNRVRWQFGVVMPRDYSEHDGNEPWAMQTECVVESSGGATLTLAIRFLQLQTRLIEEAHTAGFRPVEKLEVNERQLVSWDEGVEREIEHTEVSLSAVAAEELALPFEIPGGEDIEIVRGKDGGEGAELKGRIVRRRWPIAGVVRVSAQELDGAVKVRVRIENASTLPHGEGAEVDRNVALRHALLGAHALLAVREGSFVSLLDPPAWAAGAAASCQNQHTWPVMIGPEGARDVMLSSPIILYDYPAVAPESKGDLFDATEIDEILTLRIMTLTEEEKREARGTDERARQIIERSDSMPPEMLEKLHGAIRSLRGSVQGDAERTGHVERPSPGQPGDREVGMDRSAEIAAWDAFFGTPGTPAEEAWVQVGSERVSKGARVRLSPRRRADSIDMFLAGRVAKVEGVYRDLDDVTYVAVTVDDDPASDLHSWYGRFFYFYPEEIEPLGSSAGSELDYEGRV